MTAVPLFAPRLARRARARAQRSAPQQAADLLRAARARERTGTTSDAVTSYEAAIAAATASGEAAVLAEALRRLAVVRIHRGESAAARELCRRSHVVARRLGNNELAGEALNTLGGFDVETGALKEARRHLIRARDLAGTSLGLRARIEQNFGILASIHGDFDDALECYARSLAAFRAVSDERGCAIAYHNLGKASAARQRLDEAERYFEQSLQLAGRVADAYLEGLCLVNHAKVHVARGRFDEARRNAEIALGLFGKLDVGSARADAYLVLGMVHRETGQPVLAEAQLRAAIELAVRTGSLLNEAEASRELALLCRATERNRDALTLLSHAHALFRRLDARPDLASVDGKMAELEATYMTVVRDWGRSIESADTDTFGHCERVAAHAATVARALGLDEGAQTSIRLGAYLHDVGKVRVPLEILTKPGLLTRDEMAVVEMHPVWGVELLAGIDFPWDLKPIIRWHHERYDGSGYPDRLRGDEIPVSAQIVGIVDMYDALTTNRPYRPALPHEAALAQIERCQAWWSEPVYRAFRQTFG